MLEGFVGFHNSSLLFEPLLVLALHHLHLLGAEVFLLLLQAALVGVAVDLCLEALRVVRQLLPPHGLLGCRLLLHQLELDLRPHRLLLVALALLLGGQALQVDLLLAAGLHLAHEAGAGVGLGPQVRLALVPDPVLLPQPVGLDGALVLGLLDHLLLQVGVVLAHDPLLLRALPLLLRLPPRLHPLGVLQQQQVPPPLQLLGPPALRRLGLVELPHGRARGHQLGALGPLAGLLALQLGAPPRDLLLVPARAGRRQRRPPLRVLRHLLVEVGDHLGVGLPQGLLHAPLLQLQRRHVPHHPRHVLLVQLLLLRLAPAFLRKLREPLLRHKIQQRLAVEGAGVVAGVAPPPVVGVLHEGLPLLLARRLQGQGALAHAPLAVLRRLHILQHLARPLLHLGVVQVGKTPPPSQQLLFICFGQLPQPFLLQAVIDDRVGPGFPLGKPLQMGNLLCGCCEILSLRFLLTPFHKHVLRTNPSGCIERHPGKIIIDCCVGQCQFAQAKRR
mmetsp:Transcript_30875/g.53362  ORF Transcript_30875/g.53362 Transcript_30875/m.53362 type:complete len:502 (+) Transcript_30875:499-2004(+)